MNRHVFKLSGVALAIACLPVSSWAADTVASSPEVAQLRQELGELGQRYEAQSAALQALARRLQQLENSGQGQLRPARAMKTAAVTEPATGSSQATGEESQTTQDSGEAVVKEAPQSQVPRRFIVSRMLCSIRHLPWKPGLVIATQTDAN